MLTILEIGSFVAAEALLDNGTPLTAAMIPEHSFKNVVQYAATGGVEMLKLLATRGIFSEHQDKESEKSALERAAFKGNAAVAEYFLHDRGFGSDKNLLRQLAMTAVRGSGYLTQKCATLDLIISYGLDLDSLTDEFTEVPFLSVMIAKKRPQEV